MQINFHTLSRCPEEMGQYYERAVISHCISWPMHTVPQNMNHNQNQVFKRWVFIIFIPFPIKLNRLVFKSLFFDNWTHSHWDYFKKIYRFNLNTFWNAWQMSQFHCQTPMQMINENLKKIVLCKIVSIFQNFKCCHLITQCVIHIIM